MIDTPVACDHPSWTGFRDLTANCKKVDKASGYFTVHDLPPGF